MTDKKYALTNVRPWGAAPVDILIEAGRIAGIRPAAGQRAEGDIDGGGLLALPGFINTHSHVDKSWWGRPWVSYSYSEHPTVEGWIANERAERGKHDIPSAAAVAAAMRRFLRHGPTAPRPHIHIGLGGGPRRLAGMPIALASSTK